MSSKAMPMIIILLVVVGGIVTWGLMTDWTFSGLLPRAGVKCKPATMAANSSKYVYSNTDPPACTVIATCNTDWVPAKSNTVCEYSKSASDCTPEGTADPQGVYTFDKSKKCNLTGCKNNFKFISASAGCKSCKDGYLKDGTTCKACTASDVTASTHSNLYVEGQTYTTINSNCVPKRVAYVGNNGGVNCSIYCGKRWQGAASMPADWKGAKCAGVAKWNATDKKWKIDNTLNCWEKGDTSNQDKGNVCVCEKRDGGWMGSTDFTMPTSLTNTDGNNSKSKGWWQGTPDGFDIGGATIAQCEAEAKKGGFPAYGIRTKDHSLPEYKNSCWVHPKDWVRGDLDQSSTGSHYTVCTDSTKKVIDSCK